MPASPAAFLESLGRLHLLDAARIDQLLRDPLAAALDPKALVQELVRRGWLTPYQADQLLQGRGRELLLGSYVLLERLGEGGMGAVYKARNWKLGRDAALKVVRADRLGNPDALQRFRREIRAAAQLSHANVVHAFDAGEEGGVFFFAMEVVAGADLSRVVTERGPLPVAEACDYVRQAALGLQHAHEQGLVHRDVKPSNLLLTTAGVVKVLDLGLARLNRRSETGENSATLTQHGTLMGTLDYIAPEQAMDSHAVDHRADLYGLGCVFYYLLTGRPPFKGGSMGDKIARHLSAEPEPVQRLRPETAAVIRKLMAKNPDHRYQTAGEVAAVLGGLRDNGFDDEQAPTATALSLPPPAPPPTESSPVRPPKRGKRWRLVAAGAIVLAGLAGAIGLALIPRGGSWSAPPSPSAPTSAAPGELALESPDPAARVHVQSHSDPNKGGVLRPGVPVPLAAGEYDLTLDPEALAGLRLSRNAVGVRPGERQEVRVEGAPLSPWALVSRPAWIAGVQSWTITTRVGRGEVRRLAYSPDGRWVAFANQDGVVRLVDPNDERKLRALVGHADVASALAWSADKDRPRLASASGDGTVRIWEADTGKILKVLPLRAVALAWSPDGKTLACATDNDVLLCDLEKNQTERLQQHRLPIHALAWSAASGVLASAGDDGAVVLWKRDAGGWQPDVRAGHTLPVTTLTWSPDGQTAASASLDRTIRWQRLDGGPAPDPVPSDLVVYGLAWSPDGGALASVGETGPTKGPVIAFWDARTGMALRSFGSDSYWRPARDGVAWSPDGKTVVAGGFGRSIHFWSYQTGQMVRTLQYHGDVVYNTTWSPDGTRLATDGQLKVLRVWDAVTGAPGKGFGSSTWCGGAAWSPDGAMLATWDGNAVRRGDLRNGAAILFPKTDVTNASLAWSPVAGGPLALGYPDGTVRLCDPVSGLETRKLAGNRSQPWALAWSPDGGRLAGGDGGGTVCLWDATTGQFLHKWTQPRVYALAWSPDGRMLASAGDDGLVRVWNPNRDDLQKPLKGHQGAVRNAAWSADGKTLLSIGEDATLRTWDAETGELRRTLLRGTKTGTFSPDATRLALGGAMWTLRLWETATARPLGTVVQLRQGWVVFSEEGHFRPQNAEVEKELVYVVQTERGQETFTPDEFAERYGWKNDPDKARLDTH